MAETEKDIEEVIADRLRQAGLKFVTEKAIGGLAPDFIVYARAATINCLPSGFSGIDDGSGAGKRNCIRKPLERTALSS